MLENPESLFDYAAAVRLKEQGMMLAATAEHDWLSRARSVAEHLAMKNGQTDIEQVYAIVGLPSHANASGSVFRGKQWQCTGFKQAQRTARHCGLIRVWQLR